MLPANVVADLANKGGGAPMRESLAQLAAETMGQGWMRLTGQFEARDFDLLARSVIREIVYAFWMKNPLIARSVEIENNYTFGRGVSVSSKYDLLSKLITSFWADPDNLVELTSHQAQRMKNLDLKLFGNVYLALVTNPTTGRVKVRSFPDHEIVDIVYDPDDRRKPLLYKRQWTPQKWDFNSGTYVAGAPQVEYIMDWRAKAGDLVKITAPVSQIRKGWRIYHIKTNCVTESKFGNSEIYRAVDWAKAYNRFLEDWATVVAALSRFAFKQKVKGGPGAVTANQTRWEALSAQNNGAGPTAGSTLVEGQGVETMPMPKGGPSVTADDGRRLLLMVSAATGIMEHYFGDPSSGNLATATAMELPMQKQFESRQQLWWDVFTDLIDFAIEQSAKAPAGYLKRQGAKILADEVTGEEAVQLPDGDLGEGEDGKKERGPIPWEYSVDFPPIVQADVRVESTALSQLGQSNLLPERELVRLAARLMGVQDIDQVLDEWEKEKAQKDALAQLIGAGKAPGAPPQAGAGKSDGGDMDPLDAQVRETFIRALEIIHDRMREVGAGGRAA